MLKFRTKDRYSRVTLYIRLNDTKRSFQLINPKKPQLGGPYYLRLKNDGKRVWKFVGNDINQALAARFKKEGELCLQTKAEVRAKRTTLEAALDTYIADIKARKSEKTAVAYRYALDQFKASCSKKHLDEITVADLKAFVVWLKTQGLSDRTIDNRIGEVVTFLRANDIKGVTLKHKYVEKKVKAYHPDELKALFAAATSEERITFQFFLVTGAREQEVMHATWNDIDFKEGIFTIREHPEYGFRPKDYEEREIPLPDHIVADLKERMLRGKGLLIFPSRQGKPNGHLLRMLKELADRAGLNRADCGLHKFRKTFATLQHRAGLDARTIQKRLGHSALETTLAYLEAEDVRSERTKQQVNAAFGVFA
jgi:integrase/recombinase XerD